MNPDPKKNVINEMKIRHSIRFRLRPYGKKGNKYQIQMRASYNSQRLDFATGCYIDDPDAWDGDAQFVKFGYRGQNGETALLINDTIRKRRDLLEWTFMYFEINDINPMPWELSAKYTERLKLTTPKLPTPEKKEDEKEKAPEKKKEKSSDLFEMFDRFVAESGEKNAWTKATFQKMATMRSDLSTFKKDLSFSDLTEKTLTEFVAYLRDGKKLHKPRKKKGEREDYDEEDLTGLRNTTIEKKLGYLRWFLKWATDRGYNTNNAYKTFRPTLKKTQKKVIYLTKEELDRIRQLEFSDDELFLEPVRDGLLFCCYSGLRHSDLYNLRRSDIKDGYIEITTVKTGDSIQIELNNETRRILKKYEKIEFPGGKALPVLQNQPMNRDLKKLCQLAGIDEDIRITTYKGNERHDEVHPKWELVGTHTGRRTFIVSALSKGIAPSIVMKWTGHSDYNAMKPYIDIIDSAKADAMKKFDET